MPRADWQPDNQDTAGTKGQLCFLKAVSFYPISRHSRQENKARLRELEQEHCHSVITVPLGAVLGN